MAGSTQQKEILLAEDNAADVQMLQRVFRTHGQLPCRLHVVNDGAAALAFLRQEGGYAGMPRPAIVLLDIVLPKFNGWQVLATLRATPALAVLPVVMLTGAMTLYDEEQRVRLQPLACFTKSLQLDAYPQLVAEIEQLLTAIPENG